MSGQPRRRVLLVHDRLGDQIAEAAAEFELCPLHCQPRATEWLGANGAGIEVAIASSTARFDRELLDLLPDLRLIAVAASGITGIDFDETRRRGIAVTAGSGLNAGDVADLAVLMALALVRDVLAHDRFVRSGQWVERPPPFGRSMSSQRVGIVGLGQIGTAVARRLTSFGCDISWWGPRASPNPEWPRREGLIDLARWATVLIVAARADDTSRGMISAEIIEAIGPEGFLVNVSRGFVVNEGALKYALRARRLGGAALDVFECEPVPEKGWLDVPNILLTPHIGGATARSIHAVIASAVENVRRHFNGQPLLHGVA